jgi:arabinofuranosyltransferase
MNDGISSLKQANSVLSAWLQSKLLAVKQRRSITALIHWPVVVISFACLLVGAMSNLSNLRQMTPDDTFITMQYARHAAEGFGLRFNYDDPKPEEGFSSILHVAILCFGFRLHIDPLVFARSVSLLAFLLMPVFMGITTARVASVPLSVGLLAAAVSQLALLFVSATALHLASGMETMLHMLVVTVSICWVLAEIQQQPVFNFGTRLIIGLVAVLLPVFSRPEGAIFGAICLSFVYFVHCWRRVSFVPELRIIVVAGTFVLTVAAYILWKKIYFGGVLPNPYFVKGSNAIFGAGNFAVLPGLWHVKEFVNTFLPALIVVIAVTGILFKRIPLGVWLAVISGIPALLIVVMYSKAVHEMAFGARYEYPYLTSLVMLSSTVAVYAYRSMRRIPCLIAIIAFCSISGAHLFKNADVVTWMGYKIDDCNFAHAAMGKDLERTQLKTDASILLSGAGAVPYFSQFHAIDWVGLNNRYFSGRRKREIKELWCYIDQKKPDVIYSIFPPASSGIKDYKNDPAFQAAPVQASLKGFGCEMFKFWDKRKLADMFYSEMVYVRDYYVFGGCYGMGYEQAWLIAYVRRDSPYREMIIKSFQTSRSVDRTSDLRGVYINNPRQLR